MPKVSLTVTGFYFRRTVDIAAGASVYALGDDSGPTEGSGKPSGAVPYGGVGA